MKTQVAIIGGGPSGLLLGQLLHVQGIDAVVLERRTKAHVLKRIRAGVLERGLIDLLAQAQVPTRMETDGYAHDGTVISYDAESFRIDFAEHTGTPVMVYGQTEVTRDLYAARDAAGARTLFEVEDIEIENAALDGDGPVTLHFSEGGTRQRLTCDYVAGCDGYHGVSRQSIPADKRHEFEKVYPFGWLGILSETPPVHHELIYANSERGFALCSMRNDRLSRYYVQAPVDDDLARWSDDAFWDELRRRIPPEYAEALVTGPSIEKGIAPLRSFVCEPMQYGRLFLCGDAAHIVPPTGAKGLNLAFSDVFYLSRALIAHFRENSDRYLDSYSQMALRRVWAAENISWRMTKLLHVFPGEDPFDQKIRQNDFDLLAGSEDIQRAFAFEYIGLPFED